MQIADNKGAEPSDFGIFSRPLRPRACAREARPEIFHRDMVNIPAAEGFPPLGMLKWEHRAADLRRPPGVQVPLKTVEDRSGPGLGSKERPSGRSLRSKATASCVLSGPTDLNVDS